MKSKMDKIYRDQGKAQETNPNPSPTPEKHKRALTFDDTNYARLHEPLYRFGYQIGPYDMFKYDDARLVYGTGTIFSHNGSEWSPLCKLFGFWPLLDFEEYKKYMIPISKEEAEERLNEK